MSRGASADDGGRRRRAKRLSATSAALLGVVSLGSVGLLARLGPSPGVERVTTGPAPGSVVGPPSPTPPTTAAPAQVHVPGPVAVVSPPSTSPGDTGPPGGGAGSSDGRSGATGPSSLGPVRSAVSGGTSSVPSGVPGTPASGGGTVTALALGCPPGACVTIDGTRPTGAVDHAAAGLNGSVQAGPNDDRQAVRELDTSMYRGAPDIGPLGNYDWTNWDLASSSGAKTVLILSDLWNQQDLFGNRVTPWSNWGNYASWVRSTVGKILSQGRRVDYWDVFNEPGWNDYYSAADFQSETPQELLQQFLVTYQAIKSVDPAAAVIGPSTGQWSLTPVPPSDLNHEFDLGTFLHFAADHHLQLAAIAWHDNGLSPQAVHADAMATWAAIQSLPALGHPPMFLEEYGSTDTQPVPGIDVGYLAAVHDSGISLAGRSCWNTCTGAQLDGLLGPDGFSKTPDYLDRQTYAHMTGQMVTVTSNDTAVSAVGSVDTSSRHVVALIGRAVGCTSASGCRPSWATATAAPVHVDVVLPWSSATVSVSLSYEDYQKGLGVQVPALTTPADVATATDSAGRELVSFDIPAFADGAAYNVTVNG